MHFRNGFYHKIMLKNYLTLQNEMENTTVIERSKFICRIKPVVDETDAKQFIEAVKKEHSLATHNCYAYVADELGLVQKFSDDGEPQGTAGMPMLDLLKNRKIFKVCAVVTRYFGGVKLGTGGLVRAYAGAVADCLDASKIVSMEQVYMLSIKSDYDNYSKLLKLLSNDNIRIIKTDFSDKIAIEIAIKTDYLPSLKEKLSDLYRGNPNYELLSEEYFAF